MSTNQTRFVVLAATVYWLSGAAYSQSFNIDIDSGVGDPALGGGAPSSGFPGAAGQPGYWNKLGYGGNPQQVRGLDGELTPVLMSAVSASGGFGALSFRFEGNTGDYAALLNDAASVGSVQDGGELTYTFAGLINGWYEVYTYAVNVAGLAVDTPVRVPGALEELEVVSGPMPGNAFEHLITHSVHVVEVAQGSFQVNVTRVPNVQAGMYINGFQVLAVPEPSSAATIAFGTAILLGRKFKIKARGERAGGNNEQNTQHCRPCIGLDGNDERTNDRAMG